MSSAESEDFESADEEYGSSLKFGSTFVSKNKNELFESKLDKLKNQSVAEISNPKSTKAKNDVQETRKCKSNEKNQFDTQAKLASIAGTKSEKPKSSNKELELDSLEEGGDEVGWDFDDWGEESPRKTSVPEKTKISDDDEEGWSDFGDWGNQVEGSSSPTKNSKLDDNISQNFKKMANKSETGKCSALNKLSPDRSCVASIGAKESNILSDTKASTGSSWGGWKPWGGVVSSFLYTATEGVTSLTSHVGHGLSTVIENSIGVPDPEDLARLNKKSQNLENKECEAESGRDDKILPSFGNIVTGVTSIGNKVITGGLDTLEGIGKKTMTILQENDPLLLNKRKMLGLESDKPVLSQVLREAKDKSEEIEKNLKQMQKQSYKKQLHFESLFDHYYGLVHLEALEMLSKQSSLKLQSLLEPLTGKALLELQETLNEVKELCDLGDMEVEENDGLYESKQLAEKLDTAVEDLGIQTDLKEILKCWQQNSNWLKDHENAEAQEVYEKGLRCLAETSALAINKMHKIAEMLLIKEHRSTANEADSLVQLTTTLCIHLNGIANRFGGKLNGFEQTEEISSLITSIFLEVYNSTSYIQSAFQLFIPILQIGAA